MNDFNPACGTLLHELLNYFKLSDGSYVATSDILQVRNHDRVEPDGLPPSGYIRTTSATYSLPAAAVAQAITFLVHTFPNLCVLTQSGCIMLTNVIEVCPSKQTLCLSDGTTITVSPEDLQSITDHLKQISVSLIPTG